jgi:hypothetical protein
VRANAPRARRFELRLSAHEEGLLRELAADAGLTCADMLRQLVRQRWDETKRIDERVDMTSHLVTRRRRTAS